METASVTSSRYFWNPTLLFTCLDFVMFKTNAISVENEYFQSDPMHFMIFFSNINSSSIIITYCQQNHKVHLLKKFINLMQTLKGFKGNWNYYKQDEFLQITFTVMKTVMKFLFPNQHILAHILPCASTLTFLTPSTRKYLIVMQKLPR